MTHPVTQLELNVLVTNLPDFIEVDVSEMQAGDVIHAGDVKLPKDTMKLLSDPEGVVAHVVVQAEGAGDGEEAEVSGDAAQPEVLGEKKDEGGEG
jgi:large subunit ribosomal protein L25